MSMERDKTFMISMLSILLFNAFFIIILIFYNDIIILSTPFLKSTTKEYYIWLVERPITNIESTIIDISFMIKLLFSLIFPLEFLYIITNEKYKNMINKKNIILSLVIGFVLNLLISLSIHYRAEHYRLFMDLIPTVISSLVLLNLILNIKKIR